jgi:hypothetical protein
MNSHERGALVLLGLMACFVASERAVAGEPSPLALGLAAPAAPATDSETTGNGYVFPTPREQFRTWVLNATGPTAIAGNLMGASWRHWVTEEPVEWGDSERAFAKRFGTGSLTTAIDETTLALASTLMRQDPNYYRSPRSGFGPRLKHAVAMTFMARDPTGRMVYSPGKTFSPFAGTIPVQSALYPEGHTVLDGVVSGLYGVFIDMGMNVAYEFVLKAPAWGGE